MDSAPELSPFKPYCLCQSNVIPELSHQQDLPSQCSGVPQDWLGWFWLQCPRDLNPPLLLLCGCCWSQPGPATAGLDPAPSQEAGAALCQ